MSAPILHAERHFRRFSGKRLAQYVIFPAAFSPIFGICVRSFGLALVPAIGGCLDA
jgi:hypothetical protein